MQRITILVLLVALGCHHKSANGVDADAGPRVTPLDHLSPSEIAKSDVMIYGVTVPQGMQLRRRFPDGVLLTGETPVAELASQIEASIYSGPKEVDRRRRIYRNVTIKGGDSKRIFTITIDDLGSQRQVSITDVTPTPTEPGLSDEERWRRAGYLPDGTPISSAQTY